MQTQLTLDFNGNNNEVCKNCGERKQFILENGYCGNCHFIIQHHLHAANSVDVMQTGEIVGDDNMFCGRCGMFEVMDDQDLCAICVKEVNDKSFEVWTF